MKEHMLESGQSLELKCWLEVRKQLLLLSRCVPVTQIKSKSYVHGHKCPKLSQCQSTVETITQSPLRDTNTQP